MKVSVFLYQKQKGFMLFHMFVNEESTFLYSFQILEEYFLRFCAAYNVQVIDMTFLLFFNF